jgi:type I restriction enzyme S subunit
MNSELPLPANWRWGSLAEIAEINPLISLIGLPDTLPVTFVAMSNVGENGRILQQQTRLLAEVKSGFTRFAEDDILFAKITPCMENGKGAHAQELMNGIGFGSTEFHVLRAGLMADARFVYHVTQSLSLRQKAAMQMTGSAGQQRVPSDFFERLQLPLPPLSEQRQIARILSTVDDLIERTEALIAKYRAIKQGLLHDLLTRGVDGSGWLRPPREEAPALYKESPLGWVPREWEVAPLRVYRDSDNPHIKTGPFGSSLKTEHWVTEGVPIITIGSLGEGKFIDSELLFITEAKAATLSQYTVANGDLVFSRVADVGRSALVGEREAGWIMSSNLMRISLDTTRIVPKHLYLNLVFNPWTRQQIRQSVNAGGREVANTAILERLLFAWPSLGEQSAVATIFGSHEATVRAEQKRLDKLQHIKAGLMQDLLTGRVRVKVEETSHE